MKPGELVKASFAEGTNPSAAARKAFVVLLAKAAGDAWEDRWFGMIHRVILAGRKPPP